MKYFPAEGMTDWTKRIFLDAVLESSSSLLVAVDPEGTILFVNAATEKLFGYSSGELNGKPIEILVPEKLRDMHIGDRARFMSDPRPRPMGTGRELYGRRKDGTEFPVEISLTPKTTDRGLFVLATLVDITERKHIEQQLRESEERLRTLINATPDSIFFKDGSGRWLEANSAALDLFDLQNVNYQGKRDSELAEIIPFFRDALLYCEKTDNSAWSLKRLTRADEIIRKPDGALLTFDVVKVPLFFSDGTRRGLVVIGRDITERKRAEEERERNLSEEREVRRQIECVKWRDELLADASHILAKSLDYETTLKNVAQAIVPTLGDWCMIGLTEKHGSLRLLSVIADPSKTDIARELERCRPDMSAQEGMPKTIRTGQALLYPELTVDQLYPRPGCWSLLGTCDPKHLQSIRELGLKSFMVVPLSIRERTVGAIMIASSQENRRYSSDHLDIAKELAHRCSIAIENAWLYRDAQMAIQLRNDFISVASHELKTPLTALAMHVQMINRFVEQNTLTSLSKEKLADLARISGQQIQRFSGLIDDLLDVSRITAGRLLLNIEEIDLPQLVRDTLSRFQMELGASRCSAEVLGDAHVVGQWDRIRIEQILANLLSNAMKYGAGKPIQITALREEGRAKLIVRDNGIGIAKEDQTRIFERFERAVSIQRFGGLGLGLFIVRWIVEAHGGDIWIESEPGKGAAFVVELPLKR